MDEILKKLNINNRRHFLKNLGFGIGGAAMASMIDPLNLFSGGDTWFGYRLSRVPIQSS